MIEFWTGRSTGCYLAAVDQRKGTVLPGRRTLLLGRATMLLACLLASAALALDPGKAAAQGSSRLERLRAALVARSPALAALRADTAAAGARSAATGFSAPAALAFEVEEVPDAVDVSQAGSMMLGVSRDFLSGARRRGLREDAQVHADESQLALAAAEHQLWASADHALLRAIGEGLASRRLAAEDTLLTLAEDTLRIRFEVGETRFVDVLRLRTERLQVQSALAGAAAEACAARLRQAKPIRIGALAASFAAGDTMLAQQSKVGPLRSTGVTDTLVLSLAEVQRLALLQNPAFLADQQEAAIARGQLRQARTYNYNPEFSADAPGAGSEGSVGEYELTLTQEVEWAGQWGLRINAAQVGLERAQYTVRNAARTTLGDVSRAYFEALAADRQLAVTTALLGLNERLLAATRTQLREGEISVLEANLSEIEYGRARARVLAAGRQATSTTLELKRLTGLAADQPIRLSGDLPDPPDPAALAVDSLLGIALAGRPDLAASAAAIDQLEALRRLAAREAIPNLRLGVLADRAGSGEEAGIGFGVGLALPLWNRSRGIVAERTAQLAQAALQRQAIELRIRTQVIDAYRAYVDASAEVEVYETSVLEPARANQELLETAYRAGKVNLSTLLLLRNQLLDAELGYWEAWLAKRSAMIDLHAATANLGPADAIPTNDIRSER